jgi:DNA-directed RNA polymerase subunit RPC12/RpoP
MQQGIEKIFRNYSLYKPDRLINKFFVLADFIISGQVARNGRTTPLSLTLLLRSKAMTKYFPSLPKYILFRFHCPKCSHKFIKPLRRIKNKPYYACPSCKHSFNATQIIAKTIAVDILKNLKYLSPEVKSELRSALDEQ